MAQFTPERWLSLSGIITYELAPGFNIVITREGKQLFGQATGQVKFELFAKSNVEFYLKVVNAQIIFNINEPAAV